MSLDSSLTDVLCVSNLQVGHNMGLLHSGIPTTDSDAMYGDKTCAMGASSPAEMTANSICYNAPKTVQLDWSRVAFPPRNSQKIERLYSMADAVGNGNGVLKFFDYYVTFVRKVGSNADVDARYDNKVVIYEGDVQYITFWKSDLLADLSKGQDWAPRDEKYKDMDINVTVVDINTAASPPYAEVQIFYKGPLFGEIALLNGVPLEGQTNVARRSLSDSWV